LTLIKMVTHTLFIINVRNVVISCREIVTSMENLKVINPLYQIDKQVNVAPSNLFRLDFF